MHSMKDSVSKFRSFLSWFGVFIIFDLLFSYMRSSFYLIRVRFVYCCSLVSFSYNCYLLGWENMCEIIAIQRRILELICGSSFLVGQVIFSYGWSVVGQCYVFLFPFLSTTSSYIDDIAHIKNQVVGNLGSFHSREDEVLVFLSFFMVSLATCCV